MHSIVIPHRNRNACVALCIWSIQRSAAVCKVKDYEIIVVDNGSTFQPHSSEHVQVIRDNSDMPMLNKPKLQNIGIEAAKGDVISFLDADAVVSRFWMKCAEILRNDPELTRLCYRVRVLPKPYADTLRISHARDHHLDCLFSQYQHCSDFGKAHEGYVLPERNKYNAYGPLFGNSQFSMRRDVLGDLRYNEEYVGRGWEDLWFIRETWKRDPEAYQAILWEDSNHAMFHIANTIGGNDWYSPNRNSINRRMYLDSWDGMDELLLKAAGVNRD